MCDFGHHNHDAEGFGFLIDNPEIRELIHETRRITQTIPADADTLFTGRRTDRFACSRW